MIEPCCVCLESTRPCVLQQVRVFFFQHMEHDDRKSWNLLAFELYYAAEL